MSFRGPRAARGPRNLLLCQHSGEKQIPRFARNDRFPFSANLRLSTLDLRRLLPGAAGLLQSFGDGEEEFFLVGPGNQLDVDGKSLGRLAEGQGKPRKAREIQPLAVAHDVPVVVRITG